MTNSGNWPKDGQQLETNSSERSQARSTIPSSREAREVSCDIPARHAADSRSAAFVRPSEKRNAEVVDRRDGLSRFWLLPGGKNLRNRSRPEMGLTYVCQ